MMHDQRDLNAKSSGEIIIELTRADQRRASRARRRQHLREWLWPGIVTVAASMAMAALVLSHL